MLLKTMSEPKDLIIVSDKIYEDLKEQAKVISLESVIHALDCLQSATERMYKGSNKRVEMELSLIKLTSPELDYTNEAIISRITKLEREVKAKFNVIKIDNSDKSSSESKYKQNINLNNQVSNKIENNNSPISSKSVDMEELCRNAKPLKEWPEILNALKSYSKTIATAFNGSTAYVSGNFVLIDSPNSMAFELLRKSAQRDKMRIAIQEVTGQVYKLGPYKKSSEANKNEDKLDELARLAKDAGIEVNQN